MDSFQVYRYYLALKLHFTTDNYNVFEHKGRVRCSRRTFEARKDLYSIEKLAKKYSEDQIVNFLVANFVSGSHWGGLFDESANEVYLRWQGRQEKLTYLFTNDCDNLAEYSSDWHEITSIENTTHPYILKSYLGGHLSLETLAILNKITDSSVTNLSIADTILWPDIRRLILKYQPFLKIKNGRFTEVFRARFRYEQREDSNTGGNSGGSTVPSERTERPDHGTVAEPKRDAKVSNQVSKKSARSYQASQSVALSDYFQ
jgi:hypothetical protein